MVFVPATLACLTVKMNSLDYLAAGILEADGLTEADIDTFGASTLKPPPIVTSTTNLNWASVSLGMNLFDWTLANSCLKGGDDVPYVNGIDAGGTTATSVLDVWAKEEKVQDDVDVDEGGWELDA
jgi:coatomer protein complex subunit alpha (xenin)